MTQITDKAHALRLLRMPGAEINMGSSSGKWLWTANGRRRLNEGLFRQLEEESLIERTDDNRSRVGMTWKLCTEGAER